MRQFADRAISTNKKTARLLRRLRLSVVTTLVVGLTSLAPAQERRMRVEKNVNIVGGEHGVASGAVFMGSGGEHQMMFLVGPDIQFEGGLIENAPYSAETVSETMQELPDGNRITRESRSKVFRDSLGRTRRETNLGSLGPWATGEGHEMIFINDPVTGVHWMINLQRETAVKMEIPKMEVLHDGDHTVSVNEFVEDVDHEAGEGYERIRIVRRAGGEAPARETESLGQRMIEGVMTDGERTTTTIPAGAMGNERDIEIVYERWHSAELKVDVLTERSDPRMGKTTYKLTNMERTEPLPTLFEPPVGYEIEDAKTAVSRRAIRLKK